MRSVLIAIVFAVLLSPVVLAHDGVDQAEIMRLGDMVQHVGGGIRQQAEVEDYVEAMKPPASDADKWFISVITTNNCAACEKLKQDFGSDPWLLLWQNPSDPKQSWSHYHVFLHKDGSQKWRFDNVEIAAYPTVIVQPPRSGKYGDPTTVVYQGTYSGDPKQLASNITQAIRLYVGKVYNASDPYGISPPWRPRPDDDTDRRPLLPLNIPPILDQPLFQFPWKAVLTLVFAGFSLPAIIAIAIWAIVAFRAYRQKSGKPVLLDDETFNKLIDTLNQFAQTEEEPKAKTTRKKSVKKKAA